MKVQTDELMDAIELLSQGDDFAFHAALYALFIVLQQWDKEAQSLRDSKRYYEFILANIGRIAKMTNSGQLKLWEETWA